MQDRQKMIEKLEEKLKRLEELQGLMADPKVASEPEEYTKYAKELASLQEVVSKYKIYKKAVDEIASLENVTMESDSDKEFFQLLQMELQILKEKTWCLSTVRKAPGPGYCWIYRCGN